MKKLLRPLSFSLMGVVILLLIAASIAEQLKGSDFAVKYFYTAPWTIALWAAAVVSALAYMLTVRMYKQVITCLLHFSFVVILGGALLTHLFGKQGVAHLRLTGPEEEAEQTTGVQLPFEVSLQDFKLEYYPGTNAPMDFVSEIIITDGEKQTKGQVSMNNIFSYRHYRFYQAQYDSDGRGVTLRISYDPWGIGVTYSGYVLLLLSMMLFFVQKRTYFRDLLTQLKLSGNGGKQAIAVLLLLMLPIGVFAANVQVPPTLNRETAEKLCDLYVYYNNRVCPMQTLAVDFTTKLYGKSSYKGLSAEEVFCGWLFYYDQWAQEPCIKIKGKKTQTLLGIDGKYACLNDFAGKGKYKLDEALRRGDKNAKAADEKFRLVSMVCTAQMLRCYPIRDKDSVLYWYSWAEQLPADMDFEDWRFVTRSMDYVALCVAQNANSEARDALSKIKAWQTEKVGVEQLPTTLRFKAEKLYNNLNLTRPLAMGYAAIGLVLFFICCMLLAQGKALNSWVHLTLTGGIILLCLVLTLLLTLRWIVSGHVPLSNGFETMQFMAWLTSLITSVLAIFNVPKSGSIGASLYLPFGYLVSSMTLMVGMMSASNPQITNLMPVLQSPLLTMHVAVIMVAYCLLAFVMLNAVAALILYSFDNGRVQAERLQLVSQLLLYPAVFCLTTGIFIGAVWANISWGRYWGWDPKEVWALITMLVYAAGLHSKSIRFLQKPLAFHIYMFVAFLFVLFTYFGVNFILGGLHSYK